MMTGWTMGLEGWIWMAAWAAVLVLLVWLLVREPRHDDVVDAAVILRARFARGEIDEDEYRRAMTALADDTTRRAAGPGSGSDLTKPGGLR